MNGFVKFCPHCKSSNIKQQFPQMNDSWICITCGNRTFMPIEVLDKDIDKLK